MSKLGLTPLEFAADEPRGQNATCERGENEPREELLEEKQPDCSADHGEDRGANHQVATIVAGAQLTSDAFGSTHKK